MDPLFVLTASDGSSLILGEDPADPQRPFRLVFQHEGHGAAEPLRGAVDAFWVTIADQPHVVFAGDNLDEPEVDRVLFEFSHGTLGECTCRVRPTRRPNRRRGIWMTFPQPFGAGAAIEPGAIVTARWLIGGRIHAIHQTQPLEWGALVPPEMEPPDPDDRPDDEDLGEGTGFA